MGYATLEDMLDRFGDDEVYIAFDRIGDGELDSAAVDQALSDADDEINTYLSARYQLPLVTVPPVLTRLAAQITLYHGSPGTTMTEEKRTRYKDAVIMLGKIGSGAISLGLAPSDEPDSREQMVVQTSGKLFSDDELEMF